MTRVEYARKNWADLKAKMEEGYKPTAAEQLGALYAFAGIFEGKGPLGDLLSENLLDWFNSSMDQAISCDIYQQMTAYRSRAEAAEREVSNLLATLHHRNSSLEHAREAVRERDSEITALLDQQDQHDEYAKRFYQLIVVWAANSLITQDMLVAALTLKGA